MDLLEVFMEESRQYRLSRVFGYLIAQVFHYVSVANARYPKPLLMSNQMTVQDYRSRKTVLMKNVLHLGQNQYLTTLLFPMHRTMAQFVRDACAFTVPPDDSRILLSQHRR